MRLPKCGNATKPVSEALIGEGVTSRYRLRWARRLMADLRRKCDDRSIDHAVGLEKRRNGNAE